MELFETPDRLDAQAAGERIQRFAHVGVIVPTGISIERIPRPASNNGRVTYVMSWFQ